MSFLLIVTISGLGRIKIKIMTDGRGKQPSRNKPSTGTSKDKRIKGNGGKKPGPKPKTR